MNILIQDKYQILRKAEIKRRAERLTKKELCRMCDISYGFYMNCLNKTGNPSAKMIDSLQRYVQMPTAEVYMVVFSNRDLEEEFHHNLGVTLEDAEIVEAEMEQNGVLTKPE